MESAKINKFVNSFLSAHNSGDLSGYWNSPETQEELSVTLSRKKAPGPKRGKSSYLFFCEEERKKVSKEFPNMKAKEVTTELGVRWKKMKESNSKKITHYEELAAEDKIRYEAEKKTQPAKEKVKKTKVPKKDKTGPKRGKSSYLFFCAEERANVIAEYPEMKAKEVTTELGVRWQLLKENNPNRVKYFDGLATQDKCRYKSEKLQGSSEPVVEPVVVEQPTSTKKVKGFQLFCEDYRKEYSSPGKSAREVTEELTHAWKNLSKNTQKDYKNLAEAM